MRVTAVFPDGLFIGFTHKTLSFHSLENFNDRVRQFTKCLSTVAPTSAQRFHFARMGTSSASIIAPP